MDEASLRPPPGERLVLLGTGDGLFRYWADGTRCTRHLQGLAIHAVVADPRDGSLLGTVDGRVFWSEDAGECWALFAQGLPAVQAIETAVAPA